MPHNRPVRLLGLVTLPKKVHEVLFTGLYLRLKVETPGGEIHDSCAEDAVIPVAANPVGTGQSEGDVQEAVVKEGPAT
jgi:hypothetical protein